MADNYLITGYWGEPHVTTENDRGFNAAVFGAGKFVLPVGEKFRAEYIGNNTVRVYDGKLIDNGAVAGIPAGEYIDLLIPEAGQGMNRNDLIIFQYSQDTSTLIESGVFVVLPGTETSGTAVDPALTESDLLTNKATFDQMALWRVPVSGTVISAPVQLFEVSKNIKNAGVSVVEATSSDGVAYSATVPGITELYAGLEVTIIPNRNSASTAITLDINGFGVKNVRLPVSTNTAMLAQPDTETYFVEGRAVKLMYDTRFVSKGAWVAVDRQRQSGNDIYGSVPIEHGGTGADNAEEARENLGAAPAGYGLGANGATDATAYTEVGKVLADALDTTGIYWFADNEYANRIGNSDRGILVHYQHSLYNTVAADQIFYPAYNCNSGHLERKKLSGTDYWQPWDWVDPPMSVDVEYRTTERWYGRPVFTQLVDCMFGPNKAITETQIKVPEGSYFERAVFCSVHGANSSIVLPVMGNDVTLDFSCAGVIGDRVRISSNVDASSVHYYATVKYIKQGV